MSEYTKPHDALAVIIGRAGSQGLPGKNALPLAGMPMVCHTIEDAKEARCIKRIVVSTDGDAIAHAAASMGITIVRRPAHLANDTATVAAAVRHAVMTCNGSEPIVVVLYANVPIRPDGLIDRAVQTLIETGADSVQSYTSVGKYHPHWMMSLDADGRVSPLHENTTHRRQDLPPLFIPDGGVIAVRRAQLAKVNDAEPHRFLGKDRRGIENPPGSVVDIDTEFDLRLAEAILASQSQHESDGMNPIAHTAAGGSG